MVLQLRQSILLLTVKIQGCDRAVLFLRDSLGVLVLVFILGATWMTMELVRAKVFLLVLLWTGVPRSVLHHTVVVSCHGNRLPRPVARFCAWRSQPETAALERSQNTHSNDHLFNKPAEVPPHPTPPPHTPRPALVPCNPLTLTVRPKQPIQVKVPSETTGPFKLVQPERASL